MWSTAERRFTRHVCLRHPFPRFLFSNAKHPLPTRSLRSLRAASHSTSSALWLHHAHPFVVSAEKRTRFMQRSKVFGQAVVLSKIVFKYSHCALSCAIRLLQTNEQLSRLSFYQQWVGSGAASLSAAHVRKMWSTAERRFTRHVCLRHPFPRFLFGNAKHPLPTRSLRSLRAAAHSTSSALWLHHAHLFVATTEKRTRFMQRSKVFGQAVVLSKIVFKCSHCALSCAIRLLQTNEQLSRLSFYQQWVGSGAASLSASHVRKMWSTAERRFTRHVCLRHPFPRFLFGNAKHPLPTRSLRSLRAAAHSTSSALWLHHAHLFVATTEKRTRFMQRSKEFGLAVVLSKILYKLIQCLDWAFSNSGLEVGLPAFQLPCNTCLCKTSIPAVPFWEFQASSLYQKQVPESDSTLHQFCIMLSSCPSLPCICRNTNPFHAEKQSVWSSSCGLQEFI